MVLLLLGLLRRCGFVGGSPRQPQFRYRSLPNFALQAKRTVGLLGEAIDHAEPETAALARLLCREEWLQRLLEIAGRNSGAGVGNRQDHVIAGRKLRPVV